MVSLNPVKKRPVSMNDIEEIVDSIEKKVI